MNSLLYIIGIFIIILSVAIYIIKNYTKMIIYNNIKKITCSIGIILITLVLLYSVKKVITITNNISIYLAIKENRDMYEIYDEKIKLENDFYKDIIKKEYINSNYENPYIPEEFEYVEGSWNTGFVIQDKNKNQYVWVPCTNNENTNGVPKLERKNFLAHSLISKDTCNNEFYKEFIISALENGGFYIARYEIGKENEKPVSKENKEIFKNINREQAINVVKNMYENMHCELINGYAYDTAISWIVANNKIEIENINIDSAMTGRKSYNNIYDLFDNVMEITLETSYDTVIIRGYTDTANNATNKILYSLDMGDINIDRQSILKEENCFATNTILGFRTIIYK